MKCNSFIDQNKRFWIFCMLCVLSVTLVFAQNISVKGYVFDKGTGDPLIGASVVQKGTQNGVVTDIDGNFVINMPVNGTLVVHYIGYKSVEVQATSAAERLRIAMEENSQMLDEVVAIGYGSAKKKDLTGSIASIRLEDSPRMSLPNMNVLDALKGQLPGLDIGTATNAGGNPSFNIRGQNSIKASNNPLIVVDGVVHLGSWNELNPSDIASVDVLKDASSAAVYGSRAANGVILVTTKRGKNEPTIRFGTTIGFQTPTTRPDMLSPEGYLQLKKDLRGMNGASEADLELQNLLTPYEYSAYQEGNIINWYDECVSMGLSQDYQLSISGGTDRLNYYVSGQFLDQDGIMYNDQFRKFSVTSKIESQVTDWMKVGLKLSVVNKNADGKEADMRNAINNTPYGYKYVRFEGFGHEMERSPQGHQTTINPLWQTRQFNEDRNQNYNSLAFARIDLPWVKGLSYTFNFSLNRWEGHGANFQDERYFMNTLDEKDLYDQTKYLVDANGSKNHSTRTDWFMNHLVNFNRAFGDHSVDLTLLAERQRATTTRSDLSAKDFKAAGSTVLGIHSLELGNPANRGINTDKTVLSQLAYMARANYAYKQRYHVSASIRRDGYSGFAEGNSKYGDFFSLAGAWTVSNEKFFRENVKLINYLKLRLSYGENGNPSVGSYSTFSKMGAGTYLFGRTTANTSASSGLANKALSWEKTGAWNIGVDFSILNDRLSGNIDYYRSKTVDLLLDRAIPVMNGFQNVSDNIGEVKNWGFEFSLRSINIETKDFSWSTGLNFWMNRNKVVSLYGLDGDKDGIEDDDIANNLFIGKSLGAVYTYVFDGIIQEKDLEYMAIYGGNPGDVKFKDLNNDGKIDANGDRKIIGYTKPNFTMTMSNTLTYKNFELYFMLNWIAGGGKDNYYIANNIYANYVGTFGGGGTANWLNKEYWMPEHPSNKVPRPNYTNPYQYQFPQRHDFLRLQDLSLAYRFDRKLLRSTPVKSLRLYVAAKNLLTFTSWEGIDPETGAAYAHGNPALRNITMGVDVTF